MKLAFLSTDFLQNTRTLNFMIIRTVGVELFHMDERTDRRTGIGDEANRHFSKFWDAPKK